MFYYINQMRALIVQKDPKMLLYYNLLVQYVSRAYTEFGISPVNFLE